MLHQGFVVRKHSLHKGSEKPVAIFALVNRLTSLDYISSGSDAVTPLILFADSCTRSNSRQTGPT